MKDYIDSMKNDVADEILTYKEVFGYDINVDEYTEEDLNNLWNGRRNDWVNSVYEFLNAINKKEIPVIELEKQEMSKAIYTFEYVNKSGTPLSVFDLIVAKAAQADNTISLNDKIVGLIKEKIDLSESALLNGINTNKNNWNPEIMNLIENDSIANTIKNQYLNLLSIFSYHTYFDDEQYDKEKDEIKVEDIKKSRHLNLKPEKIIENTNVTVNSLIRACAFLQYRCGIVNIKDLNYDLMLVPLAYFLRKDEIWKDVGKINKLEYWYWSSLFGGSFREGQNEQCITDIYKIMKWFTNGDNPFESRETKVLQVEDYSNLDTLLLQNENNDGKIHKAIDKGILQYILSKQPHDFLQNTSGGNIFLKAWDIACSKKITFKINDNKENSTNLKVQDHHLCPLAGVTKIGESTKAIRNDSILNSPLNRTYISSVANNVIREKRADEYFNYLSQITLLNHCIPTPFNDVYIQKPDENEEAYYVRVLRRRYYTLKNKLTEELNSLKA